MKHGNVVNSAGYDDGHDSNPHAVNYVTLHRAVDEYAVTDQLVVVEVAANDGRSKMNDDASNIDDSDTEQDTADVRAALDAHVMLTVHITYSHALQLLNRK